MLLPIPQLDPATGLWSHTRQLPSPHHDARPDAQDISLLVVHNISLPPGEFGGGFIDDLFLGRLDASAHPYFADAQYTALSRLIAAAMRVHPAITPARITGHSHIAPGRKTDPGPCFDWPRLLANVAFPR